MSGREWTTEEIKYLETHWGNRNVDLIANHLNRSKAAVSTMANRLGLLMQRDNTPGIPITDLPDLVGVPYHSIHKTWIKGNNMKIHFVNKSLAYVLDDELIDFMQHHTNLWKPSKCDKLYFKEYDWFNALLCDELSGNLKEISRNEWSPSEISQLRHLYEDKNLSFSKVAAIMKRTKSSCINKYNRTFAVNYQPCKILDIKLVHSIQDGLNYVNKLSNYELANLSDKGYQFYSDDNGKIVNIDRR